MMTEQKKYRRLVDNLSSLGLKGMEINLDEYLEQIENKEKSVIEALCELTDIEMKLTTDRAIHGCVKVANFPFLKEMKDFDFSFQPSINEGQIRGFQNLKFLERKQNILFIGSSGVGKTHLSVSIGIEAAKNRKSTYFINCNDLLQNLKKAKAENRLEQRLKFYSRYKLLIIDEVGFLPIDVEDFINCNDLLQNLKKAKAENRLEQRLKFYSRYKLLIIDEVGFLPIDVEDSKLFFQLITKRYEKNSTIITSNIELSRWGDMFGDPVLTNAILDRLLHHSEIIKIIGDSYRIKDKIRMIEGE